jgi:thymidylate synthase
MSTESHVHTAESAYLDLLEHTLKTGTRQSNRTGVDTFFLPGATMQFDLRKGFPLLTTKKMAVEGMKGELLAFLKGAENAATFREMGCKFWDLNANDPGKEGRQNLWLSNPYRKGTDDLGRVYGAQWTDLQGVRKVDMNASPEMLEHLKKEGWVQTGVFSSMDASKPQQMVFERSINQVLKAVNTIRNNPTDRRIIVNAWNPHEFDMMALPPCHVLYQFIVNVQDNELHLCMYQRSCDMFLGVPMNIASASLFLSLVAHVTGYQAATFTHFLADTHIYENHVGQVKEQLSRTLRPLPKLVISDRIPRGTADSFHAEDIFSFLSSDISFADYNPHGPLRAPMAV